MSARPRLLRRGPSRRGWLLGAGAAVLLGLPAWRAAAAERGFEVQGFDAVRWEGGGELHVEQGGREALRVEAEPEVLARVRAEVRGGRLELGFLPGGVVSRTPVRWWLALRTLTALESVGAGAIAIGVLETPSLALRLAGSGELRIAALRARDLDARLEGSGALAIEGGAVERQRVLISGAADYRAPRLAARRAEIAIDGSGDAELAAEEQLAVRIAGAGNVRYRGSPRVAQEIRGAGVVERGGE